MTTNTQQYIRIKKGEYGRHVVVDEVFPMIGTLSRNPKGQLYVTVDGAKVDVPGIEPRNCRIKVKTPEAIEIISADEFNSNKTSNIPTPRKQQKTEEERLAEIQQRFDILDDMSQACSEGTVRALILSGPPGVGKSYGVTNQLQKANLFNTIQNKQRWEVVKGATSAIGLYKKLYEYSAKGSVIVFDDCDTVLFDDLSLNILKAALDSGKKRVIQWNTESRVLDREGIPDKFEFDGAVIFITNVKFDQVRSKKLQDHLSALMSRCHYIDLTIDSPDDKLLRIKSVIEQGMLEEYKFEDVKAVEQQILDYMAENMKRMNELSLRMAIKLAELIKMRPDSWKLVADVTCMKRGA
tara:strand:- start:261 stop:1316 length:1056 start_codon:yes stop_codon:yes gene_type:complete